jgi:hypothetical protein
MKIRLNGPSRSSRPLPTQFKATPPAMQRSSRPVSLCAVRAMRSMISSQTTWTDRARSISRCVSFDSGTRGGPPNSLSKAPFVIVRPDR